MLIQGFTENVFTSNINKCKYYYVQSMRIRFVNALLPQMPWTAYKTLFALMVKIKIFKQWNHDLANIGNLFANKTNSANVSCVALSNTGCRINDLICNVITEAYWEWPHTAMSKLSGVFYIY